MRFSRNFHQNVKQSKSLGNLLLNLGISVSIWKKTEANYTLQICPRKIPDLKSFYTYSFDQFHVAEHRLNGTGVTA